MAKIKQSVINTFNRVGIPYEILLERNSEKIVVANQFGYGSVTTTPLLAACIQWVYTAQQKVMAGKVRVDDFDRVRYFVLGEDREAYMTCLD